MNNKYDADPIIEEIHQIRRAISEKFGGDISAIAEDARKRMMAQGRPIWTPKSTITTLTPTSDDAVSDDDRPMSTSG